MIENSASRGAEPAAEAGELPAAIERQLPQPLWATLRRLLPQTPDPEAAVAALDRYIGEGGGRGAAILAADPALLEVLLAIFSHSRFLSETIIQAPELLPWMAEARADARVRSREEWAGRLTDFMAAGPTPASAGERARWLTRFKRREYLRIVLRDLSGVAWLAETTRELSQLADAILAQAYVWAWNELLNRMDVPGASGGAAAELVVIALGKLGGEELNYSSDIDLMFLHSDGDGDGAHREFFTRLAQLITEYVSATTPEGAAYRVDLRLRPGGREGELVLPLARALDYYRREARDWELQMLIRARPCAGALELGTRFVAELDEAVYPRQPDPRRVVAGVRLMRQRIHEELARRRALGRRAATLDVKLDAGGIRDIEFLCQYLQRLHGGADAWLRGGNTAIALQRLHDKGHLSGAEFQALYAGYWLLRTLEHRLQLQLGQQTHSLPGTDERVGVLARSLLAAEGGRLTAPAGQWRTGPAGGENAHPLDGAAAAADRARLGSEFRTELERRMREIRAIYLRHLGASEEAAEPASAAVAQAAGGARAAGAEPAWAARLVRQMPLTRHGERQLQRLLRSAATIPGAEAALEKLAGPALPSLARALDTSDWMAEMMIRRPFLAQVFLPGGGEPAAAAGGDLAARRSQLRLQSHRRRFGVIADELLSAAPIDTTLAAITRLAEDALARALALAREAAGGEAAELPFCVLGLGRLGLNELDLLSDLDLVFVTREAAREPAARLAARMIDVVTAYTRDGPLYAVDTRLRPGGGEGELVQTPPALAAYFAERAGVWEAASFLKARVVAGDAGLGAEALQGLWRGWRQRQHPAAALRRELMALRERMEREGHPGRWGLKTPPGGFYDADFIISSRMLAGESAAPGGGHSLAALARQLPELEEDRRHALAESVALLRAADHSLRVATGKAGRAIPASGEAIGRAEQWLARLWPHPLPGTIAETVAGAQARLRRLYLELM